MAARRGQGKCPAPPSRRHQAKKKRCIRSCRKAKHVTRRRKVTARHKKPAPRLGGKPIVKTKAGGRKHPKAPKTGAKKTHGGCCKPTAPAKSSPRSAHGAKRGAVKSRRTAHGTKRAGAKRYRHGHAAHKACSRAHMRAGPIVAGGGKRIKKVAKLKAPKAPKAPKVAKRKGGRLTVAPV